MKPPKGHVYVPVRAYLKIDMPGVIAISVGEALVWCAVKQKETDNAKIGE